ncbi:hypothetical protein ACLI4Y_08130 [Natrialbaceae archaeon A-CW3]
MSLEQPHPEKAVVERWNRAFEVLSAEPRRQLVTSLMDTKPEEAVSLPSAARSPALEFAPDDLTIALHHRHLPMLAGANYVEWTRDPFQARRGDNFEELAQIFESLYAKADQLPDAMVTGCSRLELERSKLG